MPEVCLALYFNQEDLGTLLERVRDYIFLGPNATADFIGEYYSPGVVVQVNSSDLFQFMSRCGDAAAPLVETLFRNSSSAFKDASFDAVTFNWIRCYPGANGLGQSASLPSSIDEFRYDAQYAWYTQTWRQSREQYYTTFLQQNLDANMSLPVAKEQALRASIEQATGIDGCELNGPASGE
jgi:hypothetical protein